MLSFGVDAAVVAAVTGLLTVALIRKLAVEMPRRIYDEMLVMSEQFIESHQEDVRFAMGWGWSLVGAALTALIAYLTLTMGSVGPAAYAYIFLSAAVVLLLVINVKHQLLPDLLVFPLLWSGLLFHAWHETAVQSYVYGAAAGYLVPFLFYFVFKLATGKNVLGYGDLKMFAALGAWFGIEFVPSIFAIFVAYMLLIAGVLINRRAPVGTGPVYLAAVLIFHFHGRLI